MSENSNYSATEHQKMMAELVLETYQVTEKTQSIRGEVEALRGDIQGMNNDVKVFDKDMRRVRDNLPNSIGNIVVDRLDSHLGSIEDLTDVLKSLTRDMAIIKAENASRGEITLLKASVFVLFLIFLSMIGVCVVVVGIKLAFMLGVVG